MNLENFKKDFDKKLAAMSDQDLIDAFAAMGCEVYIDSEHQNDDLYFPKYPCRNGHKCKICDGELLDSDGLMRASYPPQTATHCKSCGASGFRKL